MCRSRYENKYKIIIANLESHWKNTKNRSRRISYVIPEKKTRHENRKENDWNPLSERLSYRCVNKKVEIATTACRGKTMRQIRSILIRYAHRTR